MKNIPKQYKDEVWVVIHFAREAMRQGGTISPVVFMGHAEAEKDTEIFPMNFSTEKDKELSVRLMRAIAKMADADYIIMISEAWTLDKEKISREEINKVIAEKASLANHPAHKETVFLMLETQEGTWVADADIKRLEDGKRDFNDPEFKFSSQLEGRFASFLPTKGIKH